MDDSRSVAARPLHANRPGSRESTRPRILRRSESGRRNGIPRFFPRGPGDATAMLRCGDRRPRRRPAGPVGRVMPVGARPDVGLGRRTRCRGRRGRRETNRVAVSVLWPEPVLSSGPASGPSEPAGPETPPSGPGVRRTVPGRGLIGSSSRNPRYGRAISGFGRNQKGEAPVESEHSISIFMQLWKLATQGARENPDARNEGAGDPSGQVWISWRAQGRFVVKVRLTARRSAARLGSGLP